MQQLWDSSGRDAILSLVGGFAFAAFIFWKFYGV